VRTAIVELGANTVALLVVDAKLRRVVELRRSVAAGEVVDLAVCRELRAVMDANRVGATHAIATHARDFAAAEKVLGARVEALADRRAAELAAAAVSRTLPALAKPHHLVVDVDDDSTGIVEVRRGRVVSATRVPVGAVVLSRRVRHDPATGSDMNAIEKAVDKALKPVGLPKQIAVVGTSRTATTLAALELGLVAHDDRRITGRRIAHRFVFSWLMRLSRLPLAKRKRLPGIDPKRADVIVGGIAVYARLLAWVAAEELVIIDRGVCWGVAFERL
jgi:exopolyphosphatase/guanosine-5'-triphosphate,3'-diphosphate pyrophosphatase